MFKCSKLLEHFCSVAASPCTVTALQRSKFNLLKLGRYPGEEDAWPVPEDEEPGEAVEEEPAHREGALGHGGGEQERDGDGEEVQRHGSPNLNCSFKANM